MQNGLFLIHTYFYLERSYSPTLPIPICLFTNSLWECWHWLLPEASSLFSMWIPSRWANGNAALTSSEWTSNTEPSCNILLFFFDCLQSSKARTETACSLPVENCTWTGPPSLTFTLVLGSLPLSHPQLHLMSKTGFFCRKSLRYTSSTILGFLTLGERVCVCPMSSC